MQKFLVFSLATLCLGWLIGMSESPVISGVVTGILGILTGAMTVFWKLNPKSKEIEVAASPVEVDANKKEGVVNDKGNKPADVFSIYPVSLLIIGITIGSILGIMTRTHNLLGVDPLDSQAEIEQALKIYPKYGIDSQKVALQIFTSHYSVVPSGVHQTSVDPHKLGVLKTFENAKSECEELCMKDSSEIVRVLERSQNIYFKALLSLEDKRQIIPIIKEVCACQEQ